jgi:hypothetical protein
MNNMEIEEATLVELLFEKVEQFGKTNAELIKLKTISKTADIASSLISNLVISMVIILGVVMASIGASIWIGQMLGNPYYGYMIVSGFYMIIAIFLGAARHSLIKMPMSNFFITKALK